MENWSGEVRLSIAAVVQPVRREAGLARDGCRGAAAMARALVRTGLATPNVVS